MQIFEALRNSFKPVSSRELNHLNEMNQIMNQKHIILLHIRAV